MVLLPLRSDISVLCGVGLVLLAVQGVAPFCSINNIPLLFIDTLLVPAGQAGESWEPSKQLSVIGDLTHSLTPWSRVFLEKLTGPQLVKKFPAFYGTRRFELQVPDICPCPDPDQSSPYPHIPLPEDPS